MNKKTMVLIVVLISAVLLIGYGSNGVKKQIGRGEQIQPSEGITSTPKKEVTGGSSEGSSENSSRGESGEKNPPSKNNSQENRFGENLSFDAVCGDSFCDRDESASFCQQDCGSLLPPRDPKELYDLPTINDPSTLQLQIVTNEIITDKKGRSLRHLTIKWYSQEWFGVQNWDTAEVYAPLSIPKDREGFAAIRSGEIDDEEKEGGVDKIKEFGMESAHLLNIPIMICDCSVEPHEYGYQGASALARAFRTLMFEENDIRREIAYSLAISTMRAMTAMSQLEQIDNPSKFITFGSSKGGFKQWSLASVDERIVGFVSSSYNAGNLIDHIKRIDEDWGTSESLSGEAGATTEWLMSPTGLLYRQYYDPYELSEHITVPFIVVVGTADHLSPIGSENDWIRRVEHEQGTLDIMPNIPHMSNSEYHLQNFRALIQRVIEGRSTPNVVMMHEVEDNRIKIAAKIRTAEQITSVRLYYASGPETFMRDEEYLYTTMSLDDGIYTATLPKPAGEYLVFFVEVQDQKKGITSYTTTPSMRVEKDEV